jgi:ferric-dicitrate binding protein FerR (iron transport regulator)
MSEDSEHEDFEREERAFAEALHASVPVETFRPLDAEAIKAAARPARSGRTRWLKGMAAAAVLVVAVGIGAALLPRMVASAPTAAPAGSGG